MDRVGGFLCPLRTPLSSFSVAELLAMVTGAKQR